LYHFISSLQLYSMVALCPGGLLSAWPFVPGWHFCDLLSGGLLSSDLLSGIHLLMGSSYTVRRTLQYDRLSEQQQSFLLFFSFHVTVFECKILSYRQRMLRPVFLRTRNTGRGRCPYEHKQVTSL